MYEYCLIYIDNSNDYKKNAKVTHRITTWLLMEHKYIKTIEVGPIFLSENYLLCNWEFLYM